MLRENAYPDSFINWYIRKRLNKIRFDYNNQSQSTNDNINRKRSVVLPYIKGTYERISSILKIYHIESVPKTVNNTNQIIVKNKDKIKDKFKNNVMYKVNCNDCDVFT